jgi:hypothetical protein
MVELEHHQFDEDDDGTGDEKSVTIDGMQHSSPPT